MYYLVLVIILGLGAGAYCLHEQDVAQIAALQQQVQELSAKATAGSPQPPPSQDLGTMTTVDGHAYTHCRVMKQNQDGVIFSDDAGITEIPYWNMTADEQKEFGYDRHQSATEAEAQARYKTQQDAASAPGNP